jgi:hypothetical protein
LWSRNRRCPLTEVYNTATFNKKFKIGYAKYITCQVCYFRYCFIILICTHVTWKTISDHIWKTNHIFCACPRPGPWFPMPHVMVFLVFNSLMWDVVDCFVDISGIVDHHCLKLSFQNQLYIMKFYDSNINNFNRQYMY